MGKVLSVVIGVIVLISGFILLIKEWRLEFFFVLKGTLPLLMILAGAVALLAGIAEISDSIKLAKERK